MNFGKPLLISQKSEGEEFPQRIYFPVYLAYKNVARIEKELQKLSQQERSWVEDVLKKLSADKTLGLDIKKLKGYSDIFRVRKGNIRIMYRKDTKENIFLLAIERRREDTYKF